MIVSASTTAAYACDMNEEKPVTFRVSFRGGGGVGGIPPPPPPPPCQSLAPP